MKATKVIDMMLKFVTIVIATLIAIPAQAQTHSPLYGFRPAPFHPGSGIYRGPFHHYTYPLQNHHYRQPPMIRNDEPPEPLINPQSYHRRGPKIDLEMDLGS